MSFNPLAFPLCLRDPRQVTAVAWHEHIPFAFSLVEMLRPSVYVELGVHRGDSYLAVCQAVAELQLPARCFGVDTWRGDPHAGFYDANVLEQLRPAHDPHYAAFSQLVQKTFDEARLDFAEASVDLLHIDGLHTYDAVRHDFESWLPKMSPRSVIMFHDIAVLDRGFGVWKLWDELKVRYPSFSFSHGHGLGLIAVGSAVPVPFQELAAATPDLAAQIRRFYELLGSRITLRAQEKVFHENRAAHDKLVEDFAVSNAKLIRNATCIAELERDLAIAQAGVDQVKQGASYRIGRVLTAPLRRLTGR